MRLLRSLLFAAVAAVSVLAVAPAAVTAQYDCGIGCTTCGSYPFRYEGSWYDEWADWDMECPPLVASWCVDCPLSIQSDEVSQESIARAVLASTEAELPTLIDAYGDRLLLADGRDLVAVTGSACNPEALGVWLAVDSERVSALRSLGLASYDEAAPALVRGPPASQ